MVSEPYFGSTGPLSLTMLSKNSLFQVKRELFSIPSAPIPPQQQQFLSLLSLFKEKELQLNFVLNPDGLT